MVVVDEEVFEVGSGDEVEEAEEVEETPGGNRIVLRPAVVDVADASDDVADEDGGCEVETVDRGTDDGKAEVEASPTEALTDDSREEGTVDGFALLGKEPVHNTTGKPRDAKCAIACGITVLLDIEEGIFDDKEV